MLNRKRWKDESEGMEQRREEKGKKGIENGKIWHLVGPGSPPPSCHNPEAAIQWNSGRNPGGQGMRRSKREIKENRKRGAVPRKKKIKMQKRERERERQERRKRRTRKRRKRKDG